MRPRPSARASGKERGDALSFDFGPLARGRARELQGGDRARAAAAGDAAALVAARAGRRGARTGPAGRRDPGALSHLEGFGGRQGFGRRPALLVIDMSLGFTSPKSPLHCELDDAVAAIARLLDSRARERAARRLHDRLLRRGRAGGGEGLHRQGAGPARTRRGKPVHGDRPTDRAAAGRAGAEQALRLRVLRNRARRACSRRTTATRCSSPVRRRRAAFARQRSTCSRTATGS